MSGSTARTSAISVVTLRMLAQQEARGRRDGRRGKAGGGHLVEQGLEQVVIAAIHHGHAAVAAPETARAGQAAKSCPDDHDARGIHASKSTKFWNVWTYV